MSAGTVSNHQPRYSIIVVAWNNAPDIAQALQSCLFPGCASHEVIVVYNKSTDQTLAEIQFICNQYPEQFRLIENEQNVGSGAARNQGIRAAQGEYIIFLDGDDWFAPNALSTIDHFIAEHNPTVLYYNFSRIYPDGRVKPNFRPNLLKRGWREKGTERAGLLRNFGVCWNRAYRADFIRSHGLQFPTGLYEDLAWNLQVLCEAEKLYVVDDILVFYRQRLGSALISTGRQHFDMLSANRRVLAYLGEKRSLLPDFGKRAYEKCLDDLSGTFRMRIIPEDRHMFLSEMRVILHDFRALISRKKTNLHERIIGLRLSATWVHWLLLARDRLVKSINNANKKIKGLRKQTHERQ